MTTTPPPIDIDTLSADACAGLCRDLTCLTDVTVGTVRTLTYSLYYERICYDEDGYRYPETETTREEITVMVDAWDSDRELAAAVGRAVGNIENNYWN